MSQFGNVPERFKAEGLRGSGPGDQLIHQGEQVLALKTIGDSGVLKGRSYLVEELVVEPDPCRRGFRKLLQLSGIQGEFPARKFRRMSNVGSDSDSKLGDTGGVESDGLEMKR